MNLIGKIFIALIFLMSLVFMSFALAVYKTHQNWRAVVERSPDGLKYKLQEAEKTNLDLKNEYEQKNGEEKAKVLQRDKTIATMKSENDALKSEFAKVTGDKDTLKKINEEQIATLKT